MNFIGGTLTISHISSKKPLCLLESFALKVANESLVKLIPRFVS